MFALAMADGKKKVCRRRVVCRSVVCKGKFGEWVKEIVASVWPVGAKRASGSKKLSLACGLSWLKGRVGQEVCRLSVVCRGEKGEWVKRPVGGVWSVVAKTLSGSRSLSLACGLSWRKGRVGQEACRWRVVCRGEIAAWVKRPVVAKSLRGSRGLSAECGLSARKGRVGQENCCWRVVCRGEIAAWVKKPVGGVWSVGAKSLRGSRGLSVECGLSWRKGRVGQETCRRSVVCRGEKGEWVKEIVASVWSVVSKRASGSKKLSLECGLSWRKGRVGQRNCR